MSEWKWIDTLTRQFELCEASNGKDIVVVTNTPTPQDLVDTALIALQRTGAESSLIVLPSSGVGDAVRVRISDSIQAAMQTADLVIDCTSHGVADFTENDVLVLGSRPAAGIESHVPHPGLKERVRNAEKLLRECSEMTVSSSGGTKLAIKGNKGSGDLGLQSRVIGSWGCPHPQRRVDQWPGGFVEIELPDEQTSHGSVVLMPGDANVTLGEIIHSPMSLELEQGRISEITGECGDADLLRAYLESFGQPEVYRLVSATIGLNHTIVPASPFTRDARPDQRSTLSAGVLSLGFGPPNEPVLTLSLRTSTVSLGNVTPVRDGALMGEIAPDVYETALKG